MLRARASLLSLPLLFALAGCGAAPPPNTGDGAVAPEKAGDPGGPSGAARGDEGPGATDPTDGPKVEGPDKAITSRGVEKGAQEGGDASPPPPPPPQGASVTTTPLSGKLTQQEIADILSKNAAYFNDCYTIGAGKGREFRGTVTVKATIGPSGAVTVAQVIKSTAQNAKVDTCVVDAFKKIKFPPPKDGGTSVITFPMEFQGVEQVK